MKKLIFFVLLVSLSFLSSCKKDDENIINIKLISSESIQISNPKFTVQLYGFDPNFQDVPATLIQQKEFNSTQIPFTFRLDVPSNAAELIEYVSRKEDAMYYLGINWDSDGNGKSCNGDITIDFDKSFEVFIDKSDVQIINVKKVSSLHCE